MLMPCVLLWLATSIIGMGFPPHMCIHLHAIDIFFFSKFTLKSGILDLKRSFRLLRAIHTAEVYWRFSFAQVQFVEGLGFCMSSGWSFEGALKQICCVGSFAEFVFLTKRWMEFELFGCFE